MGQSAEELRQNIAQTRGQLGQTVDAIGDQVSPAKIVERRKEQVRNRWATTKEAVMGRASDTQSSLTTTVGGAPQNALDQTQGRPLVAGAIAFGIGFLAAAVFPGSETEGQLAQKVQDAAQPAIGSIKESGQDAITALKEPAQQAAEQLKDSATDHVSQVSDTAKDATADTKDTATQAGQQVTEQTKQSAQNVQQA